MTTFPKYQNVLSICSHYIQLKPSWTTTSHKQPLFGLQFKFFLLLKTSGKRPLNIGSHLTGCKFCRVALRTVHTCYTWSSLELNALILKVLSIWEYCKRDITFHLQYTSVCARAVESKPLKLKCQKFDSPQFDNCKRPPSINDHLIYFNILGGHL